MSRLSKSRIYQTIFSIVMGLYDEVRSINGTNSCSGFYKSLMAGGGKRSFNPNIVRVTPEDFVADVELAARAVLDKHEQQYFNNAYRYKSKDYKAAAKEYHGEAAFKKMVESMEEKVGKEFRRRKIYPVKTYLKAKEIVRTK